MIYVICSRTTYTKCVDVVTSGLNLILVTDENFAQFLESARGSSTKNGCRKDDAKWHSHANDKGKALNVPRKVIMGHSDVAPSLCEAKCEAIDTIKIFYSHANKTHFHKKGFARSLVLKVRVSETRNRPIVRLPFARKPLRLPRLKF